MFYSATSNKSTTICSSNAIKKLFCLFVLLSFTFNVQAQVNLVKNPSFENRIWCPGGPDGIKIAKYWSCIDTSYYLFGDTLHIVSNYKCSPEYFSICDSSGFAGVPHNVVTFQYPHTGGAYVNVMFYRDSAMSSISDTAVSYYQRDYMMGRLYSTLVLGQSYCVTFFVNLATNSCFVVNNIGAYLDDGSINDNSNCGLVHNQYTPQINNTSMISDTLGWTKIQGSFIANGTEKYITIGNFFSRLSTDTIWRSPTVGGGHGNGAWYEVDDVSVIASDTRAYAGRDTLINYGDSTYIGIDSNGEGMPCYWYTIGDLITPIDSGGRILVHPLSLTTYIVVMDLCGNITMDTVVVDVRPEYFASPKPSPKEREKLMQYVHVYPNPACSELFVEGVFAGCEVRLFNIVGIEVKMKTCNGELCLTKPVTVSPAELRTATTIHFDLSDLAKGIYFVEVLDVETGERVVKKVVKE